MPLPSGIQKVRVFGTYIDAEGVPLKGQILFTPSVNTAGSGVVVLSSAARVSLDSAGSFSIELPTAANTGLDPDGWTYQVDELIPGHPRRYNIVLSDLNSTGEVPLAVLAPVENVVPTGVYALLGHIHDDRYYTKAQVDDLVTSGVAGVATVNGRAGAVVLTSTDVGLANVNNTSDANKPISTATQTALNGKAALVHTHAQADVTGLVTALAGKSDTTHNHDTRYYLQAQVYTKAEVDTLLGGVGGGSVVSVFGRSGAVVAQTGDYTKAQVGLGNVDNTSDAGKPVSTATQTALNLKADTSALASYQPIDSDLTTIAGLTATTNNVIQSVAGAWASRTPAQLKATLALVAGDVGLGNVDNTSDASKPVSTATQTALNLKADASALSGYQPLDSDLTAVAAIAPANDDVIQRKAGAWTNRTMAQLKVDLVLGKADVGLGNVDNTSDANKPVSTAQQTALNLKANLASPTFTGTVGGITATMVGLGNVNNTSDANKPVSTAQQTALDLKANLSNKFEVPFAFTGTAVAATTGKLRWYNRTGRTLTIAGAVPAAATAPTGAALVVDVNKNGTTVFTTQANRPSITAASNGGTLSAAPDVTSLADGDYLTVDVDTVGSTVAGADVTIGVVLSG